MTHRALAAIAILALSLAAAASLGRAEEPARTFPEPPGFGDAMASAWTSTAPDVQARLQPDEIQHLCNLVRNKPDAAIAATIVATSQASVRFPADGQVIGDWKKGLELANNGRGGQFNDDPKAPNGGNCTACHQMDPKELSYGTLGPSLTGYGKQRGYAPDAARAAFAKIYNSQSVLACSMMPRFGANKVLTEQQIKDAVALLFDPASPVNK